MKMLGFMIVLTIMYWMMTSHAQMIMAGGEACSAEEHALAGQKETRRFDARTSSLIVEPNALETALPETAPYAVKKRDAGSEVCGG